MEEEEESNCVECQVPMELTLNRDQFRPPLEIGFESFKENIWVAQQFHRSQNEGVRVQLIL